MTDIDLSALDRELKKGAAELLLLSVLEARPRHGYELGKLIETRSGGRLVFHLDSLYPLLYRLEERGWIKGTWVEKAWRASAPLLSAHADRSARAAPTAPDLGRVRRRRAARHAR